MRSLTPLDDLIAGCRRGDPRAQNALYDRMAGRMMTVCLRYSPSRADAEEALQQAFVRVFNHLDRFRHDGSFEGWVKRIVINTALDLWDRRRIREAAETVTWDEVPETASAQPSAVETLAARDVLDLLATLPPGYRMVLNLYAIEGYSHPEIAEMLGISEGTSKSQLARARAMLEKKLTLSSSLPTPTQP